MSFEEWWEKNYSDLKEHEYKLLIKAIASLAWVASKGEH